MADEEELEGTFEEESEEGGEAKPKKGIPKVAIIALAAVIILGGGGYFGYSKFMAKPEEPAVTEEEGGGLQVEEALEEPEEEAGGEAEEGALEEVGSNIYPLDPFIVNLSDPVGNRYLRIKLALDLSSPELQAEVEKRIPQLRDSILILLSSKNLAEINTTEGKLKLKSELQHRVNQALTSGRVTTIYFTEFVVQ